MGANIACGPLFCAAKRSGTFRINPKVPRRQQVQSKVYRIWAAEDHTSKIYVRVFVILLQLYFQWGLTRTKLTPAGRKTVRMAIS
jgi:hypothetical protein